MDSVGKPCNIISHPVNLHKELSFKYRNSKTKVHSSVNAGFRLVRSAGSGAAPPAGGLSCCSLIVISVFVNSAHYLNFLISLND